MYPHQLERLTRALEASGGEALVACSAANLAYVTGFRALSRALVSIPQFAVFTRQGTALVVPAGDVSVAVDEADVDHVACFGSPMLASGEVSGPSGRRVRAIIGRRWATAPEALAQALDALGIRGGAIALDDRALSAAERQAVAERLGSIRIVAGSSYFATARRVKAPFEIECLAGALRIAEEALNEVIQMLKRGVTEREATGVYLTEVVKRGGDPTPSAVTVGDRTGLGRAWPTERALRPGELVRLDVGCVHRGYVARVGRTAVLGDPTPEQEAAHGVIEHALEAALDAAAPGRAARQVHEACVRAMHEHGLPEFAPASLGHGIGLELDEPPALAPDDATYLEAGEIVSVEVAYAMGQQGFLARDTALVTVTGARILNRSARGIVALD